MPGDRSPQLGLFEPNSVAVCGSMAGMRLHRRLYLPYGVVRQQTLRPTDVGSSQHLSESCPTHSDGSNKAISRRSISRKQQSARAWLSLAATPPCWKITAHADRKST